MNTHLTESFGLEPAEHAVKTIPLPISAIVRSHFGIVFAATIGSDALIMSHERTPPTRS